MLASLDLFEWQARSVSKNFWYLPIIPSHILKTLKNQGEDPWKLEFLLRGVDERGRDRDGLFASASTDCLHIMNLWIVPHLRLGYVGLSLHYCVANDTNDAEYE